MIWALLFVLFLNKKADAPEKKEAARDSARLFRSGGGLVRRRNRLSIAGLQTTALFTAIVRLVRFAFGLAL